VCLRYEANWDNSPANTIFSTDMCCRSESSQHDSRVHALLQFLCLPSSHPVLLGERMKHVCPTIKHCICTPHARRSSSTHRKTRLDECLFHAHLLCTCTFESSNSGDPQSLSTSARCTIPLSLRTSVGQRTTYTTEVFQDIPSRRLHAGHEHRLDHRFHLVPFSRGG
jgi:hypothetical protein